MKTDLLNPCNDYVFKRLFATSPTLLADLINAVRSDEPAIEVVEVLNPRIDPEELAGKFIVLDLLAQDADGRRYNIEMQVRRHNAWSARSAYYLARTLTAQLNSGEDYQSIKPVIGIHLLDFELFDAPDQKLQALWCFEMRDRKRSDILLGNELQLNIIELPKADRLGVTQASLAAWVTLFEHWQEENKMAAIAHPPVKLALDHLKDLSADANTRRLAFVRERALHDEVSELRAEREKGEIEGMIKGESMLLERLIVKRFGSLPDDVRTRLRTATADQLEAWAERIFDSCTLAEIFNDH
ncbi:Rpn family recombination-promoting nuclease/putative transposase [Propionivibrio sp.]|uniref:Rpn family recombination-promoting nuclease/putative transposase n=1 Tax=Propionivibrio sp. TaxID=2212460 RepID=UPI003BF02736